MDGLLNDTTNSSLPEAVSCAPHEEAEATPPGAGLPSAPGLVLTDTEGRSQAAQAWALLDPHGTNSPWSLGQVTGCET